MMDSLLQTWHDLRDFVFPGHIPGAEVTRSHSWPWGPAIVVVVFVAAAAWVTFIYARERTAASRTLRVTLAALRIALLGLVLFLLYGWMLHRHRTDLPDLVLLIDDSASMATVDDDRDPQQQARLARRLQSAGLRQPSRIALAKLLLIERDAGLLRQLQQRYRVKAYRLGRTLRPLVDASETGAENPEGLGGESPRGSPNGLRDAIRRLDADQPSSKLGAGVQDALAIQRGRPTAAMVILSDGVTTDGKTIGEAAVEARRRVVPLFTIGLGNSRPPRDVQVADLLVDDVVFVGDLVHFDFQVVATGFAGQRAIARLSVGGQAGPAVAGPTASGPAVAERALTLGQDGVSQNVRLSHRMTEQGDFECAVEVEPITGEANTQNNRLTRTVKVRDDTLRVLYVQAYPSYDFRYLKTLLGRSLKRDSSSKAVELTSVLQEADLDYAESDETAARTFPASREELFAYDVLIFGDVNPAFLNTTALENIAAFVAQRGGGLVVLAGPRYTPLAYRGTPLSALLPIDVETAALPPSGATLDRGFVPQPTRLGIASPSLQLADTLAASLAVWREMPPWYWSLAAADLRPGGRALAADPSRVGAGGEHLPMISMQFVGAGKVIFHASDETYRWAHHPDGETYYARYWIQTLRYLSRAKLLEGGRLAELTTDRNEYRRGEAVRLRARFLDDRLAPAADDGVTLILESDGNPRRQLVLHRDAVNRGVFDGTAADLPDGKYRAWIAAPSVGGPSPSQRFAVVSPPGEQARLEMDAADLQAAANTSQGRFYTWPTAGRLLADLPPGRQVRIESLAPTPIWNSPVWAAVFVALIAAEWLLRKRAGLV